MCNERVANVTYGFLYVTNEQQTLHVDLLQAKLVLKVGCVPDCFKDRKSLD